MSTRANIQARHDLASPPEAGGLPRLVADNKGLLAHNLGKSFKKRPVVRGVNVALQRGEVVGLLGPNGAGKTTCFYMITGLIRADYGRIALDGQDITDLPMYRKVRDAVKVPVLANITEFGKTPLYTREELGSVGVDIVLHCCSAYRAMNLAALKVFEAIRRDGTQKQVVGLMQTRDDLYRFLDYHAYEQKLDSLFAAEKEKK